MRRETRGWFVVLQVLLLAAVAFFIWRTLRVSWTELAQTGLTVHLRIGPVALAAAIVLTTYGLLVESWRLLVRTSGPGLSFPDAVSTWAISNLGRYLPGKVWAVAGLAVMAHRRGVPAVTATGAAVTMQLLSVGTGIVLAAIFAPETTEPWWIVTAGGVVVVTVAALTWRPLFDWMKRQLPSLGTTELSPLSLRVVVTAAVVTATSWLTYGAGIWLLARGTLPASSLTFATATGTFAASYIIGLLAVFAPGGVAVREGVLFALLAPTMGPGPALTLAVVSRVFLTATEVIAAVFGWAFTLRRERTTRTT